MMKLRLRRYETRETLEFELADTTNLHDLRLRISSSTPFSVHFSLNRSDKPSPEATLRSLGMTHADLIYYYSPPPSSPMDIEIVASSESKSLSEPFFLKKVLLEKSGDDASDFTTLVTSVHAIMLESGFMLLNNHGRFDKFSFSKEMFTVSLMYTLPELITKTEIEYVTVRFQNLGNTVVVYGSLGGGGEVQRVSLNKNRFVSVIDLVMDTLKFEKQAFCSSYRDVFMLWKMVKDGLSIPLLMGLCEKSGLELPACLMRLPTELKMKILELVRGDSVANVACVCREMRSLASDNDLWKQKCLDEASHLVVNRSSVSWKAEFATFWRKRQKARRDFLRSDREMHRRVTSPVIIAHPRSKAYRIGRYREFLRQR